MIPHLENFNLTDCGHNTANYLHLLTEALKLAFADREQYYDDPVYVDVPLEKLLNPESLRERAKQIDISRAWPEMPPAGDCGRETTRFSAGIKGRSKSLPLDTSYLCVADAAGNLFSATPSDSALETPLVPGLGLIISSRGMQSWLEPGHASALQPGKRPRLTPNPALVFRDRQPYMAFGTPGVICDARL